MATSVVNALLGYGYWTLAARVMPTAQVGLGSAATSALVIISLVVHLGAGSGLIARLPGRRTPYEWRLTVTSTLLATTLFTVVVAAAALAPLGAAVTPLRVLTSHWDTAAWFVVGAGSWTGSGVLDYVFIAERRSDLMLVRNACAAVAKLAVLGLLATAERPVGASVILASWAAAGLVGTLAGLALCHRSLHRFGRVPLSVMSRELGSLLRPTLGHHAISVCGLLPTYLLPVAVTARLGATANAYFYTTWMIGSAIFMISPAVSSALFAEGSHEGSRLRQLAWRSSLATMAVLVLPAAVLCLIGRNVLALFGPGYTVGYALLVALVLSAFPDMVSNATVATLRVRGLLGRAAALNLLIAAVALAGAWLATPRYGILGAGLAWLGAQSVGALAVLVLRRRLLPSA
ncbi:hypothetical protein [Streptomyces sp. NPDC005573]|uniref:lipopolysaccharide biosynthesis protein n=1 Tax=Streptomyces sp. NPDC005573 TaxID=3156890 RepID=UPI0033BDBD59